MHGSYSCDCPTGYEGSSCAIAKDGTVRRDPHLKTFDGHAYSFQGLCWYTLIKDCSGSEPAFEIISKFAPREDGTKTRTVAINVTVGDEYVTADGFDIIRGNQTKLRPNIQVHDGDGRTVLLSFIRKRTTFSVAWSPSTHIFSADVSGSDYIGTLCGLLGNADGNGLNDFRKPDGVLVHDADEFGESWKVKGIECDY
jgi:hypothetical protein